MIEQIQETINTLLVTIFGTNDFLLDITQQKSDTFRVELTSQNTEFIKHILGKEAWNIKCFRTMLNICFKRQGTLVFFYVKTHNL